MQPSDAYLVGPRFANILRRGGYAALHLTHIHWLFEGLDTKRFTPLMAVSIDYLESQFQFSILLFIRSNELGLYIRRCDHHGFTLGRKYGCLLPGVTSNDSATLKILGSSLKTLEPNKLFLHRISELLTNSTLINKYKSCRSTSKIGLDDCSHQKYSYRYFRVVVNWIVKVNATPAMMLGGNVQYASRLRL